MASTSNKNVLTVSEMERKELGALIVFLERVPCLFCSLFAEVLISSLYYSRRTSLLHLFCVIRLHLLLRPFHCVFWGGGGVFFVFGFRIVARFGPIAKLYLLYYALYVD
jgi:hypothetical protein